MEKEVNVYVTPKSPDTDKIREYLASKGSITTSLIFPPITRRTKRMLEATRGAAALR